MVRGQQWIFGTPIRQQELFFKPHDDRVYSKNTFLIGETIECNVPGPSAAKFDSATLRHETKCCCCSDNTTMG